MGYGFEWDANKATANHRKRGVSFYEASTVFADPLALLTRDPDHSLNEERYLVLGASSSRRLLVVSHTERPPGSESSARARRYATRGATMSKATEPSAEAKDDMRPECDFSGAVQGATARRYA